MRNQSLCAFLLSVSLLPATALATEGEGTPDNLPPPAEDICDAEEGRAKGLCTAYCEAMDCDDPNTAANDAACDAVRGKFEAATGRELPCEIPDDICPCSAYDTWDAVLSPVDPVLNEVCFESLGDLLDYRYSPMAGVRAHAFAVSLSNSGLGQCYASLTGHPTVNLPVTEAEGAVCLAELQAHTDSRGLVCQ